MSIPSQVVNLQICTLFVVMHTGEIHTPTDTCSRMLAAALFVDKKLEKKLEAPWMSVIQGVDKLIC